MEETGRLAKCNRTGVGGRRKTYRPLECVGGLAALVSLCVMAACVLARQANVDRNPGAVFTYIENEYKRGSFAQAREEADKAYEHWERRRNTHWHAKFLLLAAEMDLLNGATQRAQDLLPARWPSNEASLLPRYEYLRAYVLFRQEQYAAARSLFEDAAKKADEISDFETESDAYLLLGAPLLSGTGQGSENAVNKALSVSEQHNLNYEKAAALLDLGQIRIVRERYADAIPFLEKARDESNRSGALLLRSAAEGNLSTCYYNVGDFDRALESRHRAVAVQATAGLKPLLRDSYLDLGALYLLKGDTKQSIAYFRKALSLVDEKDSPAQYAFAANDLAQALTAAGLLDEADLYNEKAYRLSNRADPNQMAFLMLNRAAIAEKRGRYDQAIANYKEAIELGKDRPSLLWEAHAGLARSFARTGDTASARAHFEAALETIERNRSEQLRSEYQITFLSSLISFYQRYVAFLMEHKEVAAALEVADSSRASVLTGKLGNEVSSRNQFIANVQDAARSAKSAILFYWLAPEHSYVWLISGSGIKSFDLPHVDKVLQDARSYRYLIEEEKRDPLLDRSAVGRRLFDALIGPVQDSIPSGTNVILVPDGELHNLNFETLLAGDGGHYWIDDVSISIAPSLHILTAGGQAASDSQKSLLLMGDPATAGTGYAALPNAGLELHDVAQHFPQARTTVFRGSSASPSAYLSSEPGSYSAIHFATHAEANAESPLDSAIILSPQANEFRLYARDVMTLPLHADIVTISACRGAGVRNLSGEGLVGFGWAFLEAGARNVVTSLWDVNDRSTAELMDRFYGEIESGRSYRDALRGAKLAMIDAGYKKPYYWAPFQLYSRTVVRDSAGGRRALTRALR